MFAQSSTYLSAIDLKMIKEGWDCFGVRNTVLNCINGPCYEAVPPRSLQEKYCSIENAGFIVKCGICSLALEIRGAPKRGSYTGKLKKHIEEFI